MTQQLRDPRQSEQEAAAPLMSQALRQHVVTSAFSGGWSLRLALTHSEGS